MEGEGKSLFVKANLYVCLRVFACVVQRER